MRSERITGHETYQLHGSHMAERTAEYVRARFNAQTQQIRMLLLKENMCGWFEKTSVYEQMAAMRDVGGSTFELLSVVEDPKMVVLAKNKAGSFNNWIIEDIARPPEWEKVPIIKGWLEHYVGYVDASNAATIARLPRVKDVLSESQLEEWKEAGEYVKLGEEASTLVHDYIYPPNIDDSNYQPRFKNLNQIYYSFPQLLQLMSHMGYIDQGRRGGRSLPTICPGDAYRSCRRNHNNKRRPNVVRYPGQRLKELVGMLIILSNSNG